MEVHTTREDGIMPRSSQEDGEVRMLRMIPDVTTGETPSSSVTRALECPIRVAGLLPFDPAMKSEVIKRARAVGFDADAVEAWLRPMPEQIEANTVEWPAEFNEIFQDVKNDHDKREPPDERAARIAAALQGAFVTNDEAAFTAYFRVPKNIGSINYPLLMLNEATWLIAVLDEQRRALVAECRKRGRSWADIALGLGVTRASAWQRYAPPDE